MTKNLLVVVLAAVGCGNLSDPGGSDDAAGQPDGGTGDTDAGEAPIDPAVLSIVPTHWKDERGDAIDFSTGEPVHTHAGTDVWIAAGGACPAAYRYAYLMDRMPAYGREVTQNAMEIEVAVPTIPLELGATAYRLTTGTGETVVPWTPIDAVPADGRVRIALHRDEAPMLGTVRGELHFDVRVRDTAGVEQIATACWMNEPMPAPLYIETPQSALGPAALTARLLSNPASHAIDVITPTSSQLPGVYSAKITQQTAEPVTVVFAPAPPTGTYSATLVRAYLLTATMTAPGNCEDYPESCNTSPLPATTTTLTSGALTSGAWSISMVDEVSGATLPCALTSCALPARAPGAAPHPYRVTVAGSEFTNLWPQIGTLYAMREITVAAGTVIGVWQTSNKILHCARLKTIQGVTACASLEEYTELAALDRATLAIPALKLQVLTGTQKLATAPVPYLANGAVTTPPVNWSGGDGPL